MTEGIRIQKRPFRMSSNTETGAEIISSRRFGTIMHQTVAGLVSKGNYLGPEIIDCVRLQRCNWSLQANYFTFPLGKEKNFLSH